MTPAESPRTSSLRRRFDGTFEVDEWGLDPDLLELVSPLVGLRWTIAVEGAERLGPGGPALLVHNRRFGLSEPFVVARGVRLATGRFVRPVGVPDVAPVGPALRRMGGVLGRPDEIAGLLKAGSLVAVPLERELRFARRAGACDLASLEAALDVGSAVHPIALIGRESGRHWRLLVGDGLPVRDRSELRSVNDWAEALRQRVQGLLDSGRRRP